MEEEGQILWTAGFLNERFPAPVSPLGWSVVGPLFEEYALRDPLRFMGYPEADRITCTRLIRGHPYANVLVFQILYSPFPEAFLPVDAVRYFPEGDVEKRRTAPYPRSILNLRLLSSLLVHALQDPINWSPFNYWEWQRYTRAHDKKVADLNSNLAGVSDPLEVFQVLEGAKTAHANFLRIHRWSLTYADLFFKLLTGLAGQSAQSLIADVTNMTWQVDQDLSRLSAKAEKLNLSFESSDSVTQALANPEFGQAVQEFVSVHGHRSFSLDIAEPTFRDEPGQFLRMLLVTTPSLRSTPDAVRQAGEIRAHLPIYQRKFFDILLKLTRRYAALREDQRYYWQKSLAITRRAYMMLASELQRRELLDENEDIFYADADEIKSFFTGTLTGDQFSSQVRDRREKWRRYWAEYAQSTARAYPAFLQGDRPLSSGQSGHNGVWQGRAVSPGQAIGVARVVLSARDLPRVEAGEILVAPSTDPGWTPVFSRLSAVVVERGGVLAHSAILAREHRLPAVAGISNITQELADGDWIEVDGTLGLVRRVVPK